MNKNPSEWIYSKSLRMKFRTRETEKGVRVQTEDQVVYTENEVRILWRHKMLTPEIHAIKKIFDGEITEDQIEQASKAQTDPR